MTRITHTAVEILRADGTPESLPAEAVFLLTGYHSDTTLLAHAGVTFDPVELAPTSIRRRPRPTCPAST